MTEKHQEFPTEGFGAALADWQRSHGRHAFSWQRYDTPYERWLSEVMLQQTRTTTVEGYFQKFLRAFPTVEDLARATDDEVQALWAGLGYYSRARNLHKAAKRVAELGGVFPKTAAGLAELPGVGPSTAGAIAAFCYGERAVMCDGNAKRVLARVMAIPGAVGERAFETKVWSAAESLLPASEDMAAYTQGLMDVGAEICRKKAPRCAECPVRSFCRALREGRVEDYPAPRAKRERPVRCATLFFLYGLHALPPRHHARRRASADDQAGRLADRAAFGTGNARHARADRALLARGGRRRFSPQRVCVRLRP